MKYANILKKGLQNMKSGVEFPYTISRKWRSDSNGGTYQKAI